jgi:hypothetical protein
MVSHSSASVREQTPHTNQTTRTATVINALRLRSQAVLNDESIDAQSRAIIRYGLETNDPWLAELVRRVDKGKSIVDTFESASCGESDEEGHSEECSGDNESSHEKLSAVGEDEIETGGLDKIEALAELICGAGEESAGALLVLMGMLERSTEPKAVVNTVKHFAFTRCGELNLNGMVDAQIATLESELLTNGAQVAG